MEDDGYAFGFLLMKIALFVLSLAVAQKYHKTFHSKMIA